MVKGFLVIVCDCGSFEVAHDIKSLSSCSVCSSEGEDDCLRLSIVKGFSGGHGDSSSFSSMNRVSFILLTAV